MSLQLIELESGNDPRATVIVLHGLGADGNDFVPVVRRLQLDAVGPVRFVLPDAPERPVTRNGGYVMRAWFDLYAPGANQENEADVRASQALVEGLIAREVARGIAPSRIVLMGFSQGCAMALFTGLRHPQRLAGLVALSGYLPMVAATATEVSAASTDLPVFMAHGRQDDVVTMDRALAARDTLSALGLPHEWHEYDMGHEVSIEEIRDINAWLLRVLA